MEFERSMQGSMGMNEPMREDSVTKSIEHYTSAIPSSAFLGVALGAIGIALVAQSAGRGKWGNFIAQWVPTLLILGVYNKLVKVEGHDQPKAFGLANFRNAPKSLVAAAGPLDVLPAPRVPEVLEIAPSRRPAAAPRAEDPPAQASAEGMDPDVFDLETLAGPAGPEPGPYHPDRRD